METVENQKIIIVKKDKIAGAGQYTTINYDALDNAALKLKDNSFKLWLYIAKNANNYQFALSRVAFCNWANCSKPTYLKAVQTLQEKGFLVAKNEKSNIYIFYSLPNETTYPKTEEDLTIEFNEKQEVSLFHF